MKDNTAYLRYLRFKSDKSTEGKRIDRAIVNRWQNISRSQLIKRVISIKVDFQNVTTSYKVKTDQLIEVRLEEDVLFSELKPYEKDLNIIKESGDYLCINKEAGLVVHPGAGNYDHTLANILVHKFGLDFKSNMDQGIRPGIIHRLDKDTSGVLLVAKNRSFHEFASEQFRNRSTKKVYLALVQGTSEESGKIETYLTRDPIQRQRFRASKTTGKFAKTIFKRIWTDGTSSLLKLRPISGRTHQLRIHCEVMGHPILGDPIYGTKTSRLEAKRLMLHALSLEITVTETERMQFIAGLEDSFVRELVQRKVEQEFIASFMENICTTIQGET